VRASFLKKISVIFQSVASTLGVSIIGLYLRYTNTYTRPFADRVLRWWSRYLLKAARVSFEVLDPHEVAIQPDTPYVIMSNHRSHYDIPLIFVSLPGSIRMLTKKELFRIPVWGRALKAAEFLSIDRRNHDQALKDLEYAKEKMKSGVVLWIAPEGTRSRTGDLGQFKKGGFMVAIQTGARIIPVGITGSEHIHKPDTWELDLDKHVRINIGKPIDASLYSPETRDQLMGDVRGAIESLISSRAEMPEMLSTRRGIAVHERLFPA